MDEGQGSGWKISCVKGGTPAKKNTLDLFLFLFLLSIYSLLGPCPMSDVTCSVSTVPSSISLVELYIYFGWLSLKRMSGRMCRVSQLLGGWVWVWVPVCGRFLLG